MNKISKNNWITTNLPERYTNREANFVLTFNPYPFKKMLFEDAVEMTVKEIASKYSNLYLALSGGYDSEFILRAFHKHGVPITPIIVLYGNEAERAYAYKACNELVLTPIEITITDNQFINYFYEKIYQKFNGIGFHGTQVLFAAEYVEKHGGTLLTGGHFIGTFDNSIADDYASTCEWDFYTDYLYPTINKIDFYMYSLELTYSMFPDHNEGKWAYYKHQLLNLEYRDKIRAVYSLDVVKRLRAMLGKREDYAHTVEMEWTREEWDKIFENYIIKKN
jgi:hypothetical protein